MIVDRRPILNAETLLTGLSRSLRGVVRVTVRGEGDEVFAMGTGWFVTDGLVVIPRFFLNRDRAQHRLLLETFDGSNVAWSCGAELTVPTDDPGDEVVVVKPDVPADNRALRLNLGTPKAGDLIAVLHFPRAIRT